MNQTEPFGENSDKKLRASTLVNDETLRIIADFASALSNANNVKISDLLAFLVIVFYSSYCFHPKII